MPATAAPTEKKQVNADSARKRFKFRLLRGPHHDRQGDPTVNEGRRKFQALSNDKLHGHLPFDQRFPLIETTTDLSVFNGKDKTQIKFQPVTEQTNTVVEIDPRVRRTGETIQQYMARLQEFATSVKLELDNQLREVDKMDLEGLREFAEDNEIDVEKAKGIDDMRRMVKAALSGK